MPDLIVIYGAPVAGKSAVAWELARSLEGPTAVVSVDHLLGAIAVPHPDAEAEIDMAHTQLRLLVVNYLKNRYNVVVEGSFILERDGALLNYESEIDQLLALMRNMVRRSLIVQLDVSEDVLRQRLRNLERDAEIETALRQRAAARGRYGENYLSIEADAMSPQEIAGRLRAALTGRIG